MFALPTHSPVAKYSPQSFSHVSEGCKNFDITICFYKMKAVSRAAPAKLQEPLALLLMDNHSVQRGKTSKPKLKGVTTFKDMAFLPSAQILTVGERHEGCQSILLAFKRSRDYYSYFLNYFISDTC